MKARVALLLYAAAIIVGTTVHDVRLLALHPSIRQRADGCTALKKKVPDLRSELDKLFADAQELLETFDEKLLEE